MWWSAHALISSTFNDIGILSPHQLCRPDMTVSCYCCIYNIYLVLDRPQDQSRYKTVVTKTSFSLINMNMGTVSVIGCNWNQLGVMHRCCRRNIRWIPLIVYIVGKYTSTSVDVSTSTTPCFVMFFALLGRHCPSDLPRFSANNLMHEF